MENIYVHMKTAKILKVGEFVAVNESELKNLRMCNIVNEDISVSPSEPLFESEQFPSTSQIEPAVIALPVGNVTIESLTNTISNFLKSQRIKEKIGFSIGNFFSGDYKSGQNIWNEKSLCVSLTGTISDRGGTIATAVEIMAKHHLPMILVLNESGILEIANTGTVELKPHPQNRIKRIGE